MRKKAFFIFVCIFSAGYVFLNGCVNTEYNIGTHRQDIFFYSTDKEISIGENIARQIAKDFKISSNPLYLKRVRKIGEKIAKVCDRKELNYYFNVISEDKFNAFSIPGGYVYIYEKLLKNLDDDELAFVLAHEVGHIVSRHGIKRLQAALGYNLLILASSQAPSSPDFQQGLSFALAQVLAAYSREDELNADELAVKYLKLLGVDPKAGIRVLEKLYQERKKKRYPINYFRTHPFTSQRIAHIKKVLHLPLSVEDLIND